MRVRVVLSVSCSAVILSAACAAGCSAADSLPAGWSGDDGGAAGDDGGASGSCPPCVSDKDCTGARCVQLASDSYCAPECSGSSCSSDRTCTSATTSAGAKVQVCVPRSGVCSGNGGEDGGGPHPDSGVPYDGGGQPPPSGTVGPNGGTLSRLFFAVVGDTRPANYDDVAGYPTAIITKIYADVEALNPRPAFVVSTGDYQFASSGSGSTAGAQFDIYVQARSQFSNVLFPAMGNHECTGAVASNCGQGSSNGITANYTAFLSKLLSPIQKTSPYYSINVNATNNAWTSKFVFVAANAWDSTQQSWLQSTLAQQTTYTFVVRHEPSSANTAPGVTPSDQIIAQYPYTLLICGHSHTYSHYSNTPKQVLFGNGGAPLTNSSKNYGYGIFSQRANDGAIVVDAIDYQSGNADSYFHFAVKADGSPTN